MACDKNRLILEINQGVARGYNFTIKVDGQPMNLSGYKVRVAVKIAPYYSLASLIQKEVSENSNEITEGLITDPNNGKFQIQFTKQDTLLLQPDDYALIVQLVDKDTVTNISGEGRQFALLRVCGE